ncbi:deoxyribonuclease-4 [Sphingomonas sp. BE270]|jgi:L-ribulose-5-phosphate 3-epimerase|uniref:sugar phosphate isomerase/epimerase family protein n=1 Tax=Sphingomonas sp. BE270 TaxID=2817726 RepID=UPI00285E3246|nr:sugar phosphate isomerase/epimerase family protein [Sphingomonas sp. BE270]MDR7260054.1 deoxyribonuclease-4 [Sphingomonas sp. BE270]
MSGFPLGVNTISDTWTVPLEQSLLRLSKLGYRQFDVMVSPAHLDIETLTPADYRRIRSLLDAEGIAIHALTAQSLDHNLASPRDEIRAMTIGFKKKLLNVAYELGAKGVVTVSGRYNSLNAPPRAQLEGWLRGSLEVVVAYAERVGVDIFLENIPMGVLPTAREMIQWVDEIGSPALGVCYDVANAHYIGEDLAEGIQLVAPHLRLVHLSDTSRTAWKHDPIGTGTVDFAAAGNALKAIGYQGLSVVEILAADPDPATLAAHEVLTGLGWAERATRAPALAG